MNRVLLTLGIPALLLSAWTAAHAGEPAMGDPTEKDIFVVYDAASGAKPPPVSGIDGVATEIKPAVVTASDQASAGFQITYKPGLKYAAMVFDAASSPKTFADPQLPVEPEAVWVTCRAASGSTLVVRVGDGTKVFEYETDIPGQQWRLIKIGLSPDMKGWNLVTGGDAKPRKNAALTSTVRMVSVGLRARDATTGSLDLARVAIVPSPLAMIFATSVVNNLFVPGDKPIAQILLDKGVGVHGSRIWIEDAYGNVVKELPPETLSGGSVTVTLPGDFGYYSINAMIPGYRAGRRVSYGVIPDNQVAGKEPNSPFGANVTVGSPPDQTGALAKRVGIAWLRTGDFAIESANRLGLCLLGGRFEGESAPHHAADIRRPDGSYDFSADMKLQAAYAVAHAGDYKFWVMDNEPVFAWSKVFGAPAWVDAYSRFYTPQFYATMADAAPGAILLAESYPFEMEVFLKAGGGKDIGVVTPHPYTFGVPPEDRDLLNGGYARQVALTSAYHVKWPVWITEIGFTTAKRGDSAGKKTWIGLPELGQAAQLVRACCLHYAAGVEKIFIYNLVDWPLMTTEREACNTENHFGQVRFDNSPKPSIVAYANMVAQIKGCRWLGRVPYKASDQVYIYAFQRGDEKPKLVAWTRSGTAPMAVPAGAQLTDLFGKRTKWGGGDLTLTENPVYIAGCEAEVQPIPTYSQLPRVFDSTDVKLGPRYGTEVIGASR